MANLKANEYLILSMTVELAELEANEYVILSMIVEPVQIEDNDYDILSTVHCHSMYNVNFTLLSGSRGR